MIRQSKWRKSFCISTTSSSSGSEHHCSSKSGIPASSTESSVRYYLVQDIIVPALAVRSAGLPSRYHKTAARTHGSGARYTQLFEWVREVELLVLDDLGAHTSSAWSTEKFLQILDARASSALATVITAIPKEFQGLDERLRSRLSNLQQVTTVLFEKARDYRPFKIPPGRSTQA